MESLEGITLKCKQWIQSGLGTAVKAGQRQEWWGQNRQGSRGLVSQGMLCLGAVRFGKAVMAR